MHRVTPILQHLWQDVADPRGFVLEASDGCDNLSLHNFWVGGGLTGEGGGGGSASTSGAVGEVVVNN